MVTEAALRRELQKILGFDVSSLPMNNTKSALSDRLDPENVGNVVQSESDEVPCISPILDLHVNGVLSKPKDDSHHPTGPSLMLSDPSIPKSTSAYSSKRTTGQPSFTENVIRTGAVESALSGQLERQSRPTGLQVGGTHYKKMPIQPVEFAYANNIPFIEGCIIKYVCRWKDKGGIEDLRKAKHFLDILIELEEKNEKLAT